jgi:Kef-type K+ transport system membrane component KefB
MHAGQAGAVMLFILLAPWSGPVAANVFASMHNDPIAPVILGVTGILFFAIIGRFAARKIGLPSVLGEVIMGILLGNVAYYLGLDLIVVLREGPTIFDLERLTIAGKALDMAAFATLVATSVGITARVLKDLDRQQSPEARIILGAAVIDDIMGLLMLAIVSGIVVSGSVELLPVLTTTLLAFLFLAGALYLGPYLIRIAVVLLCRLDLVEAKMFTSYLFVMVLAWMANLVGLATIIGAFTAGLILSDSYFKFCNLSDDSHVSIKSLIMPLEVILVPIFFILMGIQVKLETFLDYQVLMMAAGLLLAAIIGKIAAGIGASRTVSRITVVWG